MDKSFYEAVAMLIGTIIGAGIFALPYAVSQTGVLVGVAEILLIGAAVTLLHVYLGEVSLRTEGKHQLTGYAGLYLGKWGKKVMTFSFVVGIYGALIAYTIGEGAALNAIFGINRIFGSLIFFAIMAFFFYKGLNIIRGWELWLGFLAVAVVFTLLAFCVPSVDFGNIRHVDLTKAFLPYGVILFAALGTAAIPTLREEVKKHKSYMKTAILVGSMLPLFVYILFAVIVVGVSGLETSEIATIRLGEVLGQHILLIGNIFIIFAMATSCLSLGLALSWVYQFDYKLNKQLSWLLVCAVPLVVVLFDITTFIQAISITGAIAGGIDGVIIVLMHKRAKMLGERKPEYTVKSNLLLYTLLILMFILGIIYTVWEILAKIGM